MKIGLVDVDSRNFPNLTLMKLSSWHKSHGDDVEWWNGFTHYDRMYLSKRHGAGGRVGGEPTAEQKAFARWVNVKSLHRSCAWAEYRGYQNKAAVLVGSAG